MTCPQRSYEAHTISLNHISDFSISEISLQTFSYQFPNSSARQESKPGQGRRQDSDGVGDSQNLSGQRASECSYQFLENGARL